MSGGWLGALQRARLAGGVVKWVVQGNPGSPQNAHAAGFPSRGERPRPGVKRGNSASICGGFPQVNTVKPHRQRSLQRQKTF